MAVSTISVISKDRANRFRKLVKLKNNGRIHGMLRPEFERAIENHISILEKEIQEQKK